jgi:hypothetical protein
MIRKMLVIAAAIAMPTAAVAGVTAVTGAGTASAKALPPVPITCGLSGTVTFSKPGLSYAGSITNKTVEKTKTDIVPAGGDVACPIKAIKNKILTTPTQCWSVLPTYVSKTDFSGGTPVSGAAPICSVNTKGTAVTNGTMTADAAGVKAAIKDQFYYDTASSLASAGTADIAASLAAGIPTSDNGTKVTLEVTASNVASILPGHACGSDIGFGLTGDVVLTGTTTPVTLGSDNHNATYSLAICLTGDTGTGTTGAFFADYLSAAGGNTALTIASAILGTASTLSIS